MTKLCFIGHFGGNEAFREGQTVKTRAVAEILEDTPELRIQYVDTYYYKRNLPKFAFGLLTGLIRCNRVLLCVSKNGRNVFFPLLYGCASVLKKKVYHVSIGGRLADEVTKNRKWRRYVQSFQVNWVESQTIVEWLKAAGVTNGEYLPNFKKLPVLSSRELPHPDPEVRRFCMFSRIMMEKGVTDAIRAVAELNQKYRRIAATLDLYGPVEPEYRQELQALLAEHGEYVRYRGEAEPGDSVTVLRSYDVLLFPTRFLSEGMPGTIIDAFCAGVPVIARAWKWCGQILTHEYNGFCYDFDHPELLAYWTEYALNHPDEVYEMKKNCLLSAGQYQAEAVAPQLIDKLTAPEGA